MIGRRVRPPAIQEYLQSRHPTQYELVWLAVKRPALFIDAMNAANRHNVRAARRLLVRCEICDRVDRPIYRRLPVRHYLGLGVSPLRDNFLCTGCGSSLRQRAIYAVVRSVLDQAVDATVVDTDEHWSGREPLQRLPGYIATTYDQFGRPGELMPGGARNEDLTCLTFSDASVDVFISGDVHEHIEDTMRAFREVQRVLKQGGVYVFTIPYRHERAGNEKLAHGSSQALMWAGLEQIHGDPRSGDGAVAYWLFGRELLDDLGQLGFKVSRLEYATDGLEHIPVEVFTAQAR